MRVWRVEHRDHRYGPYNGSIYSSHRIAERLTEHNSPITHPATGDDGLQGSGEKRHGFDCPDKMKEWFQGWADDLAHDGYCVRIFDVPDHLVEHGFSRKQVLFRASAAKCVGAFRPTWE